MLSLWDCRSVCVSLYAIWLSSGQLLSCVRLFATPWTTARQASCPSPTPRVYPNLVHWVGDAIQPSHPLSSPSPPIFNHSQHQGLCKWISSYHQVAKVLELQLQHQSFQWIFRTDSFRINWISLQSKWLSRIFCNTIFEKHLFFGTRLFFWSNSHIHIWMLEKIIALTKRTFVGKIMSLLFNILSRFVITFLPRSKHLLILAAVTICSDFGAQENKVCHCFH